MAPPRPNKKRRIAPTTQPDGTPAAPITTIRQLQELLSDNHGTGLRQVRDFLNRCSKTPEITDEVADANRKILKEYLEIQCRHAAAVEAEEDAKTGAFADITAVWSYAFQNNSQHLMTMVPATLSIMVRVCSFNEELRTYGAVLIKAILQQANLKIIYRSLTGNKDHHISPCLRLLAEMNRFDFGALCGLVQQTFDFTIKDLVKSFEVRSGKVEVEQPGKPSNRTLAVRFFLSFLQNGEASVRAEMLGLRTWVSAIFKNLKLDTPQVVNEVLDCLKKQVLDEREVSRAIKTTVFNDWVLSHILSLYAREEGVKVYNAGKEEDKTVAGIAHEFLMATCTTPGNGVCFPDQGWYPPGYSENEDKRKSSPKVYNRALAAFSTSIRPYADTNQLDLSLALFKACPELVADHFLANPVFSFEPKLTSTWIGYCTFLLQTISLPVLTNFGNTKDLIIPPPIDVVLENVLPKPLSKSITTNCLKSPVSLIRFLTTKLLIAAFQKLRRILAVIDATAATLEDPTESWLKHRLSVVEEFCKRIPDISLVTANISAKTPTGILQSEAQTKLLAEFYCVIPEMALTGRFDINVALSNYLDRQVPDDQKAFNLLEMSHLLQVAKETPDAKWWNKTPAMKHSPFVSILKLCSSSASKAPLHQVRALLHNFASTSYLFQTETAVSTLDALLESLTTIAEPDLEPVLSLLDEVISRCVNSPFKYLDDFVESALSLEKGATGPVDVPPVSPVVMTLVEQWKFFAKNKTTTAEQKIAGACWLRRFLDSCALLGENGKVIALLCERLEADTEEKKIKEVFKVLRRSLKGKVVVTLAADAQPNLAGGREIKKEGVVVDKDQFMKGLEEMRHGDSEVTLFRLAAAQKALFDVARSDEGVEEVRAAVASAGESNKHCVLLLVQQGEDVAKQTKLFVAQQAKRVEEVVSSVEAKKLPVLVELFHTFAGLLEAAFEGGDAEFEGVKAVLKRVIVKTWELCGGVEELSQKLAADFRAVAGLGFNGEDVDELLGSLTTSSSAEAQDFMAYLIRRASERSEVLAVDNINTILATETISSELSSALVTYVKDADSEGLQGIIFALGSDSTTKTDIECAIMKKLNVYRKSALKFYNKKIKSGEQLPMFSSRFSALLEAYSVSAGADGRYTWDEETPETTRTALQALFDAVQDQLLEDTLDSAQVEVFLRAASLFDSTDRKRVLEHIAGTKKRSMLMANTVNLLDVLIEDKAALTSTSMKHFLLLSFDQLTRKLSDATNTNISESLAAFIERLSTFLQARKAPVSAVIPAGILNTLITAILTNHVATPSTTSLLITLLALVPGKLLEIKRFLQMLIAHPENPLCTRGGIYDAPSTLQRQTAYLLHVLFWSSPDAASTLITMDSTLELYRATDDPVDRVLLAILTRIESHLTRSIATRITTWAVTDHIDTVAHPLISRLRGRLALSLSSRVLQKSTQNFNPCPPELNLSSVSTFLDTPLTATRNYDPAFILPIITYMLHTTHTIDTATFLSKHCLSYTMATLSHSDTPILTCATALLTTIPPILKHAPVRTKTQLHHHISALINSLPPSPTPLPTITSLLHASISSVLQNPAHVMYPRIIQYLLRSPTLDLFDLPLLLAPSEIASEEELKSQGEHEKETSWVLGILVNGCRKKEDVEILRKRNVVDFVLGMGERGRAEELLWNIAGVEGGATTLVTRGGVVGWAVARLAKGEEGRVKRVMGRVLVGVEKEYVERWSRGLWGKGFVEGVLKPEGLVV